jgi:hypothetical protein
MPSSRNRTARKRCGASPARPYPHESSALNIVYVVINGSRGTVRFDQETCAQTTGRICSLAGTELHFVKLPVRNYVLGRDGIREGVHRKTVLIVHANAEFKLGIAPAFEAPLKTRASLREGPRRKA